MHIGRCLRCMHVLHALHGARSSRLADGIGSCCAYSWLNTALKCARSTPHPFTLPCVTRSTVSDGTVWVNDRPHLHGM